MFRKLFVSFRDGIDFNIENYVLGHRTLMPITFPFWMDKFILFPNRCQPSDHPPALLITSNSLARRFTCDLRSQGLQRKKHIALALTEVGVLPFGVLKYTDPALHILDVYRIYKDQPSHHQIFSWLRQMPVDFSIAGILALVKNWKMMLSSATYWNIRPVPRM